MNFYSENKEQLGKVKLLSQELAGKYTFKYAAIRDHGPQIGIRLNVQDDDAYKGTGEYYDRKTLQPMPDTDSNSIICDSCTEKERMNYTLLLQDTALKQILQIYKSMKPDAIRITHDDVFFSLGSSVTNRTTKLSSDGEAGILMSFTKDVNDTYVIKKIGDKVYLYETFIH